MDDGRAGDHGEVASSHLALGAVVCDGPGPGRVDRVELAQVEGEHRYAFFAQAFDLVLELDCCAAVERSRDDQLVLPYGRAREREVRACLDSRRPAGVIVDADWMRECCRRPVAV